MPSKTGTCFKEKGVLVTVYVEKPKRRTFLNQNHHHHHHHHHRICHTVKREIILYRQGGGGGGNGKEYISRRAELLHYSQHLRRSAAARSAPTSSAPSKPRPNNPSTNQQPHTKIVGVGRKATKNSKGSACFGNWRIPHIFGIFTTCGARKEERKTRKKRRGNASISTKIKGAIRSFKVQKQRSLFSKVLSSTKRK